MMFIRVLIGMIKTIRLSLIPYQAIPIETVKIPKRILIASPQGNLTITLEAQQGLTGMGIKSIIMV